MPTAPEVIAEGKAAILIAQQPDVIAYKHRKRVRIGKKLGNMTKTLSAKRRKILQPTIIAEMAEGTPATKVAKKLRIAHSTMKAVVTDPSFNRALTQYQNETLTKARNILIEATIEASEKLRTCMRRGGGTKKVQLAAAESILSRCNVEMPKVTQSVTHQYTPEETDSMLKVLKEATELLETHAVKKSPYLLDKATSPTPKAVSGQPS